ncbi:MAG: CAP domain-containing protein [Planctomycetota bacterium]|jgi:uncharacterized protein YkwD
MKLRNFSGYAVLCIVVAALAFSGCSSSKKDKPGGSSPAPTGTGTGTPYDPGSNPELALADERSVLDMVNTERANAGLGPLTWCNGLYALAKAHSNDMCARSFFDHVNPENEDPTDRATLGHAGSFTFTPICPNPYGGVGENIAHGYATPAAVMQGWMNSPGHRANILNSGYTHIGVGQCDPCKTHWTQNFGIR